MERVKELYVVLEDKPGALGELCKILAESHINIETIAAFNSSAKLFVENIDKTKKLLEKHNYTTEIREVLKIELENKPGELAYITSRIGHVGINIDYLYTAFNPKGKHATVVLDVSDIETAISLFKSR